MTQFGPLLESVLLVIYAACAVTAAGHALLYKRDPRSAWGWIAVCWLFPVMGALLYYWFGINRIHHRALRYVGHDLPRPAKVPQPPLPQVAGAHPAELRELVRIGTAMTGRTLESGNRIEPFYDGEQAYAAMLDAIAAARHFVHLATYIFLADTTGERFAQALAAAQRRGVQVRVLLDGVSDAFNRMRASRLLAKHGLQAALFLPPRVWPPMLHVNLRNHRKLLLVDGAVGFTGGMNVADYHWTATRGRRQVTDVHFRVQGPVLRQMEAVFCADWCFAANEALHPVPVPATPAPGGAVARVITDGPNEDLDRLALVLLGALANAHRRVWIVTPYFLPPPPLLSALQAAALRGVDVSILLPERSDLPWVDWATRNLLWQLLERQVKMFYQPAPFAHTKLLLVDDYYLHFGSANMDARSLRLNFELVMEAYDPPLVAQLAQYVEGLQARARPIRLEELRQRPLVLRLRDAFFWLFSTYL